MNVSGRLKTILRKAGTLVFGKTPKLYRIPFGPLRGHFLYTTFENSPRAFLGIYDPWLGKIAAQYIKTGDVVFDIGAQIGYTALLFAKILKNTCCVHAFEILPSTCKTFLARTIESNSYTNIKVYPIGFYSEERDFDLPIVQKGMTSVSSEAKNGVPHERCHVTTIDRFLQTCDTAPPAFCKMDVERAEIDCLKGASGLLSKSPPVWVIEFHGLDMLQQGTRLLEGFGYRFFDKTNKELTSAETDRLDCFHDSVLCLPPSIKP